MLFPWCHGVVVHIYHLDQKWFRHTHTVVSPASVGGIEETDHISVHYTSQVSVHHDCSDDGRSSNNNCILSTTSKLMKHCLYILISQQR